MPPRSKRHIKTTLATLSIPPTLQPNQTLARVTSNEGRSRFILALPNGTAVTAMLDERFRNAVFIGRGSYVLYQSYRRGERMQTGEDATGEIINVVVKTEEREWRKMPYWPREFEKVKDSETYPEGESKVGEMPPSDSEEE